MYNIQITRIYIYMYMWMVRVRIGFKKSGLQQHKSMISLATILTIHQIQLGELDTNPATII